MTITGYIKFITTVPEMKKIKNGVEVQMQYIFDKKNQLQKQSRIKEAKNKTELKTCNIW